MPTLPPAYAARVQPLIPRQMDEASRDEILEARKAALRTRSHAIRSMDVRALRAIDDYLERLRQLEVGRLWPSEPTSLDYEALMAEPPTTA